MQSSLNSERTVWVYGEEWSTDVSWASPPISNSTSGTLPTCYSLAALRQATLTHPLYRISREPRYTICTVCVCMRVDCRGDVM